MQRDFINNMTHEFKTPLSSILLASTYLNKQEAIQKDTKLEKYTEIIINQSKKLNSHIEQILNIAKSDNAPMTMNKKEILLVPIIKDVIDMILIHTAYLKTQPKDRIDKAGHMPKSKSKIYFITSS